MKYKLGDLVLIKDVHLRIRLRPLPLLRPYLINTLGIITEVKKQSTENINIYVWYSQVDQKEYHFYQDEVDGEVIV